MPIDANGKGDEFVVLFELPGCAPASTELRIRNVLIRTCPPGHLNRMRARRAGLTSPLRSRWDGISLTRGG